LDKISIWNEEFLKWNLLRKINLGNQTDVNHGLGLGLCLCLGLGLSLGLGLGLGLGLVLYLGLSLGLGLGLGLGLVLGLNLNVERRIFKMKPFKKNKYRKPKICKSWSRSGPWFLSRSRSWSRSLSKSWFFWYWSKSWIKSLFGTKNF